MARRELTPEEKAVTEIQPTEQDIDQMEAQPRRPYEGEPGDTGQATDVDRDDDQMQAAASRPLIDPGP